MQRGASKQLAVLSLGAIALGACSVGEIGDTSSGAPAKGPTPPPDAAVAQGKYPTMDALWNQSISRTCGPNNGVCHQNKQYPHMELAQSMTDMIGARCNQLVDRPEVVANLCEPPGDVLRIGSF